MNKWAYWDAQLSGSGTEQCSNSFFSRTRTVHSMQELRPSTSHFWSEQSEPSPQHQHTSTSPSSRDNTQASTDCSLVRCHVANARISIFMWYISICIAFVATSQHTGVFTAFRQSNVALATCLCSQAQFMPQYKLIHFKIMVVASVSTVFFSRTPWLVIFTEMTAWGSISNLYERTPSEMAGPCCSSLNDLVFFTYASHLLSIHSFWHYILLKSRRPSRSSFVRSPVSNSEVTTLNSLS